MPDSLIPLTRRRTAQALGLALAIIIAPFAHARQAEPGPSYSQKPERAPSRAAGTEPPAPEPSDSSVLDTGPVPSWIWGPSARENYTLHRNFPGTAKRAWLEATADNHFVIRLNGRPVAQGDEWSDSVEIEIADRLRPEGDNELAITVTNDGGPAGFALKIALIQEDGSITYIVSDAGWVASAGGGALPVKVLGPMGMDPWGDVFARPSLLASTPRELFQVPPGFQVERLLTVPREELGSWVSITFDPQGRLLASDQEGKGLSRITPSPIGTDEPTRVERLDLPITSAQGMLCAFDSLYLSVNGGPGSGLYRARDTDGDDHYDTVEKLKDLQGSGEHGPHALRLSPDGKSIDIVAGNHTRPPADFQKSRIPLPWDEDLLLPRQWDARGHARGILAPGGWIARTDPDGATWEILSTGYRNAYDFAYNADGERFAYDSDMEWDMGAPWYRPTRVVHATSGSEFGWRSGTGKWPTYYPDSLPPMLEIGPGSPVGVTFGYGLKAPAPIQKALLICDWTFGTIYALHLEPQGATYTATKEEFLSRTPLPVTDLAVGPDGALYFTTGGRGIQTELYRVTYTGDQPTDPVDASDPRGHDLRALRHKLEALQTDTPDPAAAVPFIWTHLNHPDRFIRYAARVALEHQPVATWQARVLAETDPTSLIAGSIALSRQGDPALQEQLIKALDRIEIASLDVDTQLALLRAWSLVFIRMGPPDEATAASVAARLDPLYPAADDRLNRELASMLVYLKSPTVIAKTLALLDQPSTQRDDSLQDLLARNASYGGPIAKMLANRPDAQKLHYALVLRNLPEGWTLDQRRAYFGFLQKARSWSGGASFEGFVSNIDKEAFENASESERLAIEATGARVPYRAPELPTPEGPGHAWTLDEILARAETQLASGRNFERGQLAFAAARCIVCHRFAGEGGATGPDLTQAAGRFAAKDLAEAILDPNRVISDQYRASTIATRDGQVLTGRIVSETTDTLILLTDPEDSTKIVELARDHIEEMQPSPVSLMPDKLIDTLNESEVLDLLAYLLSRGDPSSPPFQKPRESGAK